MILELDVGSDDAVLVEGVLDAAADRFAFLVTRGVGELDGDGVRDPGALQHEDGRVRLLAAGLGRARAALFGNELVQLVDEVGTNRGEGVSEFFGHVDGYVQSPLIRVFSPGTPARHVLPTSPFFQLRRQGRTRMSVEQEAEIDIEREAARVVELEEDIREARESVDEEEADAVVDATFSSIAARIGDWASGGVHEADVVSAERDGLRVRIRFEMDGEIDETTLPFPDDPTDGTEPLVRLCRREGVKPERVGDLDTVPVADLRHGNAIVLPPARDTRRFKVKLPGGVEVTPEVETLDSRVSRYLERWQRVLVRTPVITGSPGEMRTSAFRGMPPFFLGLVVGTTAGVEVGQFAGLLPGLLVGVALFLLGIVTTVVSAKTEMGDVPETR